MTVKVILGSASPWRRDIFRTMGFADIGFAEPDIDEKAIRDPNPSVLTRKLAAAKAEALIARLPIQEALLITSDQVVVWHGEILEKPRDEAEARLHLKRYGHGEDAPATVTAVQVTSLTGKEFRECDVDIARIHYRPMPDSVIDEVVKNPETYGLAGSLSVTDGCTALYVMEIEGKLDSVVGLPTELVYRLVNAALRSV